MVKFNCEPSRIRTYDPRLRRALLCPAELLVQIQLINNYIANSPCIGRALWTVYKTIPH